MRALIVDDDVSMSRLFRRCLSKWGWMPDECHSVSDAAAMFKSGEYDLVVCDGDLPDGNGIVLAQAFLRVKPALTIVIVTGGIDNMDRARAAGLPALQKPFDLDALRTAIEAAEAGRAIR